jgi:hypothetical protein
MAFDQAGTDTPTSIGLIIVSLKDAITGGGPDQDQPYQVANFQVEVLDQNGVRMEHKSGDLAPHITAAQRDALMGFLDSLRVQAEQEILP